jgi:FkbM family methyltransferase
MNLAQKVYRRARLEYSRIRQPKDRRHIRHVTLGRFDLLVFANEDVGREIWQFGRYEDDESNFFALTIKPDDICFDVGGNIGFFSMLMASCATAGSVHVFEPIAFNASMITTNQHLNGFANVVVNNVAVGDETGSVTFSVSVDSAYSSMHATGRQVEARSISVPILRLDDYCADHAITRVDIMKVDVEGAEAMVIAGAKGLLTDPARRPRMVLLELFDLNLVQFGTTVTAIIADMVAMGYQAGVLASGGTRVAPYTPSMANRYPNIIFTPA